jgi:hypothetical protein
MNGVDVTHVTRNYTSKEWDKLRYAHVSFYQRRKFLSGRSERGERGGRNGNCGGNRAVSRWLV